MNFIYNETSNNKHLISKFSMSDGNLILDENAEFKSNFDVSDIVTLKNNTKKIGVVSFIDDEDITINWNDNTESNEYNENLIIIPTSIGLQLLEKSPLLKLWESLSNGKNESFNLKCLYFGDTIINEVPFIKSFKNTNTLIDKRFKRSFNLYRKFNNKEIFRTNLYTIINKEIKLDKSRYVYYLLQDHIVYYLGINLSEKDLNTYLYNKNK